MGLNFVGVRPFASFAGENGFYNPKWGYNKANLLWPLLFFMEFILPELRGKKCGVYRILFDDKWVYIGGSVNLKNRMSNWVFRMNNPTVLKNRNIKYILPTISTVKFNVVEFCDESLLRHKETSYIGKLWEHKFLLNLCPDASCNNGKRVPHLIPVIVKEKGPISLPKKVAVFDKRGNFIKVFDSFGSCSKSYNIKSEIIHKILSGKRGQHTRLTLKLINDDGSFSDPPVFKRKKRTNKF